ncbi:hypothetical protein C489_05738 [Natrinema versiforme JCM 10478]|uniref:Uncharacterized protein n=1 Tax=Natrinema versiforme JCM 10478 TaxID=1227496 RepID=L9Y7C7_9EURY|nr:hypothetical protein C489_05738 [Natrinema versiforme JCM 10478]
MLCPGRKFTAQTQLRPARQALSYLTIQELSMSATATGTYLNLTLKQDQQPSSTKTQSDLSPQTQTLQEMVRLYIRQEIPLFMALIQRLGIENGNMTL